MRECTYIYEVDGSVSLEPGSALQFRFVITQFRAEVPIRQNPIKRKGLTRMKTAPDQEPPYQALLASSPEGGSALISTKLTALNG